MSLHEVIKTTRKEKGVEQKFIAEQIGMKVSSYNMKENGKRAISTDELELIAKALGVSVGYFFEKKIHVS